VGRNETVARSTPLARAFGAASEKGMIDLLVLHTTAHEEIVYVEMLLVDRPMIS
jgi:hypothetical protein